MPSSNRSQAAASST
jgi:hypothetical protein